MAKIGLVDAQLVAVEELSKSENYRVLKQISNGMSRVLFNSNLSYDDFYKLIEDGMVEVRKLLGSAADDFMPLCEVTKRGLKTYFREINEGYKEKVKKSLDIEKIEKKRDTLIKKISSCKEKGKFNKVSAMDLELKMIDYPTETKKYVNTLLGNLETQLNNHIIDVDSYKEMRSSYDKLLKLGDTCLKFYGAEEKYYPNLYFLNKVQEDIREFLCYLFFERDGKTSESPNRFLMNFIGSVVLDFEHLLLLYNYLKFINYSNIMEVKGVLYYYAIEEYYRDIYPILDGNISIVLRDGMMEFYTQKYRGYNKRYFPIYIVPKGYDCYIFEPKNLAQHAFLTSEVEKNSSINSLVDRYIEAQEILRKKKNGIFFDFLNKDIENKLMSKIASDEFPLQHMNGEYSKVLLDEFLDRRKSYTDSVSLDCVSNLYNRIIKPYELEVLGSYIKQFCSNIAIVDLEKDIFIYYVSPERVAIAVKKDIDKDLLSEIFDSRFFALLEKEEFPLLEDIIEGKYL